MTALRGLAIACFASFVVFRAFLFAREAEILSPSTKSGCKIVAGNARKNGTNEIFPSEALTSQIGQLKGAMAHTDGYWRSLMDHDIKLKIMGASADAGALAGKLLFRKLGIMNDVVLASDYPMIFRDIFATREKHRYVPSEQVCSEPEWVCIKVVCSPLDRVVSSWIQTMTKQLYKTCLPTLEHVVQQTLKATINATFADYIVSLTLPNTFGPAVRCDDLFPPQVDSDGDFIPHVYHVLLETIEDGLDAVELETGLFLNASGLAPHRVMATSSTMQDASNTGLIVNTDGSIANEMDYDAYLLNDTVNEMICRLYAQDIVLYAQTCNSELLLNRELSREWCSYERERIRRVCGEDYDYFLQ